MNFKSNEKESMWLAWIMHYMVFFSNPTGSLEFFLWIYKYVEWIMLTVIYPSVGLHLKNYIYTIS